MCQAVLCAQNPFKWWKQIALGLSLLLVLLHPACADVISDVDSVPDDWSYFEEMVGNSQFPFEIRLSGMRFGTALVPGTAELYSASEGNSYEIQSKTGLTVYMHSELASIWSSNGEYLVLKNSLYEGVTVFGTPDLPEVLSRGFGMHSVKITSLEGDLWWHKLGGWVDQNVLEIFAGPGKTMYSFKWNVKSGTVTSSDLSPNEYSLAPEPTQKIVKNPTLPFELVIDGDTFLGAFAPHQYLIRSISESQELEFIPDDPVSLEMSHASLQNAWSPDGRYLVLPLGRFAGFAVFDFSSPRDVMEYGRRLRDLMLLDMNGVALWHSDVEWSGNETVLFRAGLSNTEFSFRWNVTTMEISSDEIDMSCIKVRRSPE